MRQRVFFLTRVHIYHPVLSFPLPHPFTRTVLVLQVSSPFLAFFWEYTRVERRKKERGVEREKEIRGSSYLKPPERARYPGCLMRTSTLPQRFGHRAHQPPSRLCFFFFFFYVFSTNLLPLISTFSASFFLLYFFRFFSAGSRPCYTTCPSI